MRVFEYNWTISRRALAFEEPSRRSRVGVETETAPISHPRSYAHVSHLPGTDLRSFRDFRYVSAVREIPPPRSAIVNLRRRNVLMGARKSLYEPSGGGRGPEIKNYFPDYYYRLAGRWYSSFTPVCRTDTPGRALWFCILRSCLFKTLHLRRYMYRFIRMYVYEYVVVYIWAIRVLPGKPAFDRARVYNSFDASGPKSQLKRGVWDRIRSHVENG